MPMSRRMLAACLALLPVVPSAAQAPDGRYGLGQAATAAQIKSWDVDVAPDGRNLPTGRATIAQGRALYAERCAGCHGERGEGGLGDRLVGGRGTLATPNPVKTVGSYWPYATTLFDYVRRAMPLTAPQSLSDEEVYATAGYVLFLNGLVDETAVIDASLLTKLKMPNRDGFVADPRPDVHDSACLRDCAATPP